MAATHVLIGTTGSVAAVRTPGIQQALEAAGYATKVVVTECAKTFITEPMTEAYDEAMHWADWTERQEVLHIELRKRADLLLIAPLDANTLAKLACGLSDNLLVPLT